MSPSSFWTDVCVGNGNWLDQSKIILYEFRNDIYIANICVRDVGSRLANSALCNPDIYDLNKW